MAATRFDTISKLFAQRKSSGRIAQDVTPSANEGGTPAAWNGQKIPYLFVQSFGGGTIAPKGARAAPTP